MKMHALAALAASLLVTPALADPRPAADPWQPFAFLEGTWDARTSSGGAVSSAGTYTFARELDGHVLARHSTRASCTPTAPAADCAHGDLLYIYEEPPGQPVKAIYFDSEGHVIHYDVTFPTPTSVTFLSEAGAPGPRFRLVYERTGVAMAGRFQIQPPGATAWKSYLEWSGAKK